MLSLTSALLHDIGHGPFSHAIESITKINHEDFTTAIISGKTKNKRVVASIRNKTFHVVRAYSPLTYKKRLFDRV